MKSSVALAGSERASVATRELRVLCGPTAAGKSAIAMVLAERFDAAVISADSRQVYRRFDVGTAKPGASDRARVRHFGLDVAEPEERYSAARWSAAVDGWLAECDSAGQLPLVVGGTGFYLRALFEPLFAEPHMDADARRALHAELGPLPLELLRARCRALDPARAELGRTQLIRAIEVATLTGQPISALHADAARHARYRPRYLVVDPGDALGARIASRADAMLEGEWPDEVRELDGSVSDEAPAWNATGYAAVRDLTRGAATLAATRERVIIGTRQYAKRQRTWFRHQLSGDVRRLDPLAPTAIDEATEWFAA